MENPHPRWVINCKTLFKQGQGKNFNGAAGDPLDFSPTQNAGCIRAGVQKNPSTGLYSLVSESILPSKQRTEPDKICVSIFFSTS
jgi:hypothetical protein